MSLGVRTLEDMLGGPGRDPNVGVLGKHQVAPRRLDRRDPELPGEARLCTDGSASAQN